MLCASSKATRNGQRASGRPPTCLNFAEGLRTVCQACPQHLPKHRHSTITAIAAESAEANSASFTPAPRLLCQLSAAVSVPEPAPSTRIPIMLWALVAVQAVGLIGATVTGSLARRRRLELEKLNRKLRKVNAQLMKRHNEEEAAQQEAEQQEAAKQADEEAAQAEQQAQALAAARASLASSLDAPSAAHPFEFYGNGNLSLAQARQKLSGTISDRARSHASSLDAAAAAAHPFEVFGNGNLNPSLAQASRKLSEHEGLHRHNAKF